MEIFCSVYQKNLLFWSSFFVVSYNLYHGGYLNSFRIKVLNAMQWKKNIKIFTFCFMILMTVGCLKSYQEIRIKSDLSGTMEFKFIYDMEAITTATMMIQGMMGPKMTPEQKEMMQEQKEMMQEEIKKQFSAKNNEKKKEIESQLPEGIKLTEFFIDDSKGNKVTMKICMEFDHIRNLKKLENLKISEDNFMGGSGESSTKFLEHFSVEEKGNTIIIKQDIGKPKGMDQSKGKNKKQMPPEIEKMIKDLGINFRIRIPYKQYKVAEHNAHKYDQKAHTLYWMYSGEKLIKMSEDGKEIENIYVKLEKK